MRIRRVPLRLVTGAFILNSGLSKRDIDVDTAQRVHDFATTAYPDLKRFRPEQFASLLSTAEIALGTALLVPFVPTGLAGLALTGFSAGLVGLYWRVPGMRKEGDIRPTEAGTPLAKDVWMLGIGVALLLDAFTDRK
jgi:hypothetical protein